MLGAKSSKRYYDDLKDKYTTENLPSSSETETEEIEETQEETQTQVETEEPSEEDEQAFVIPEREIQWDELRKENVDIYAWIYIPDTKVDYPIVQHPTDDEYYVDHAIDGETDKHGAIFSQATYNDLSCSDFNTILYGHNMLDGSMFKGLHSYLKQDFFDEHPYIFVYMPDRTDVYAVYAQYTFTNELIPYAYDFETDKGREEYLSVVNSYRYKDEHSIFKMEYTPTAKDYLLTLSTCTSPKNSKKRFLVQGVRIHSESSLVPREQ